MMLPLVPPAGKSPFDDSAARHSAGRFGMMLFLVTLGVLFVASLISMLVIRVQLARDGLWPEDLPPLLLGTPDLPALLVVGQLVHLLGMM